MKLSIFRSLAPSGNAFQQTFWFLAVFAMIYLFDTVGLALPEGPALICEHVPASPHCSPTPECSLCHNGAPPSLNPYGQALQSELQKLGADTSLFEQELPSVLSVADSMDSDGDGKSNQEELANGTQPGVSDSAAEHIEPEDGVPPTSNPYYNIGAYDFRVAYKRLAVTYCGQSATYGELKDLAAASNKREFLHKRLDTCLQEEYWKTKGLPKLADPRIRPMKSLGTEGDIVLGDYQWDYRLFTYVLSDDRDARDLLLAQYHVDETMQPVTGRIDRTMRAEVPLEGGGFLGDLAQTLAGPLFNIGSADDRIVLGTGQPLISERRAGMITTQWFFVLNTMFADLPRTAAAQAYRAYLGLDMAIGEGLMPQSAEPRDVDNKGVAQAECAVCHSTLDPAAYAFSTYNGIDTSIGGIIGNGSGKYNGGRTDWEGDGAVLGQPVGDLLQWAEVAANSDAFKKNLARMFFEQALGRSPTADEQPEFMTLWQALPDDGYSANKLIHRLIDMQAFGGI